MSQTPGQKGKRPKDEVLRKVVEAKAGIVSAVAEALQVDVRTVQRWKARSRKVAKMFEDVHFARLDLAEAELIKAIKRGSVAAMIFYLKCHGKQRGNKRSGGRIDSNPRRPEHFQFPAGIRN